MELSTYILPLRRWWWLLLVATAVAAIASFIAVSFQEPVYQSRTTLLIGTSIEDPNPTTGELTLAEQLAAIYADIATRDSVRRATAEALGLKNLPQYSAQALPKSQIIEILVLDTVPRRAQAVAQELANQLISVSPTSSPPDEQDRIDFINEQLNRLQEQINDTESEIESLQAQLGDLDSALQIQETGQQITALQNKLTTLQTNYSALLANTQQGATNSLTILEPANLPSRPVNQDSMMMVILAAVIGLVLAALAAYLLEYLDRSIKTPDEITKIFNSPVLGFIPKFPNGANGGPYVTEHPNSAITEAFRSLRINLEFASTEKPLKSIFLTSADASAGKTTVSVNLAIMLAQGGHKVFLIDADLRRPSIHSYLGLPNKAGLSNILLGEAEFRDSVTTWENPNLNIVPAGRIPQNPAEILNTEKMDQVLVNMNLLADFVIIDGPPILVADAFVLASKVDGVLVVVQPGKTDKDLAVSIEEQIERIGTPIVGVVFNQIPKNNLSYYGKHWYYSPYYSSQYTSDEEGGKSTASASKNKTRIPAFLTGLIAPAAQSKTKPNHTAASGTSKSKVTTPLKPPTLENGVAVGNPPKPPKARAILRWEESEGSWKKLVLREGDNILIGRDQINDVTIHSRHVSRRHAVITWRNNQFEIADLGSTNGTLVNGVMIGKPIELMDGDRIRLFDVELTFENLASNTKKAEVTGGDTGKAEAEGSLPA